MTKEQRGKKKKLTSVGAVDCRFLVDESIANNDLLKEKENLRSVEMIFLFFKGLKGCFVNALLIHKSI